MKKKIYLGCLTVLATYGTTYSNSFRYPQDSTPQLQYEWRLDTPAQLIQAESFKDGIACIETKNHCGCIDKTGKIVIPFQYAHTMNLGEGLVAARKKDLYALFNLKNELVQPFQFEAVHPFAQGLAAVQKGGKWGFMDKTGKIVIPFEFDYLEGTFSGGRAGIRKNNLWGFIDLTGKITIPPEFHEVSAFYEGVSIVQKNRKYGLIDTTGKWILPLQSYHITPFKNGFARYGETFGNWGFINKKGNIVAHPQWREVKDFEEGVARVNDEKKWGIIDTTGEYIIQPQYDWIQYLKGCIFVRRLGKWGAVNKNGQIILPFEFDWLSLENGKFAGARKGTQTGIIQLIEPLPQVHWNEPSTELTQSMKLEYTLNACLSSITNPMVTLRVDGKVREVVDYNRNPNQKGTCDFVFNQIWRFPPRPEPYLIELEVANLSGVTRTQRTILSLPPRVMPEKRLALVIGNGAYQQVKSLGQQPIHDANDMANALQQAGFTVHVALNADKTTLETKVKTFTQQLKDFDVGLVFYAGHGVGVEDKNYVLPVDFPKQATKTDVSSLAIDTKWIQTQMENAGAFNKTNILIFDACRDEGNLRALRSLNATDVWQPPTQMPTGFITCFATSQGEAASNGKDRNGLYTSLLLKHLLTQDLKLEDVFKRVRTEMVEMGAQEPEEFSKLTKDFYFNPK